MGIRFACHCCGKSLNIKSDLAGRRGICPECRTRFRIPLEDAEFSAPIDPALAQLSSAIGGSSGLSGLSGQSAAVIGGGDQSSSATGLLDPQTSPAESDVLVDAAGIAPIKASATPIPTVHLSEIASDAYELIESEPDASWYVRPQKGGQFGPADGAMLKAWIGEKRVAKNSLLWREGWPQWRDASEVLPKLVTLMPGDPADSSSVHFGDNSRSSFEKPEETASQSSAPSAAHPSAAGLQKAKPSVGRDSQSVVVTNDSTNKDPLPAETPSMLQIDAVGDSLVGAGLDTRPDLAGASTLGRNRRKRSARRITLVAVLATLVIGLIATLVIVATSQG